LRADANKPRLHASICNQWRPKQKIWVLDEPAKAWRMDIFL
jgi:hypothetical protein